MSGQRHVQPANREIYQTMLMTCVMKDENDNYIIVLNKNERKLGVVIDLEKLVKECPLFGSDLHKYKFRLGNKAYELFRNQEAEEIISGIETSSKNNQHLCKIFFFNASKTTTIITATMMQKSIVEKINLLLSKLTPIAKIKEPLIKTQPKRKWEDTSIVDTKREDDNFSINTKHAKEIDQAGIKDEKIPYLTINQMQFRDLNKHAFKLFDQIAFTESESESESEESQLTIKNRVARTM